MNKFLADCFWCALALTLNTGQAKASSGNDTTAMKESRLNIGGYGEAVMSRMFYSDNWKRYTDASKYKNASSNGQFALPHVVLMLDYNFGCGWTMGSEMEFEHGGTESAVEIEEEETGGDEKEVEHGGEFALEQFWIQKSFSNVEITLYKTTDPTNNYVTRNIGVLTQNGNQFSQVDTLTVTGTLDTVYETKALV